MKTKRIYTSYLVIFPNFFLHHPYFPRILNRKKFQIFVDSKKKNITTFYVTTLLPGFFFFWMFYAYLVILFSKISFNFSFIIKC